MRGPNKILLLLGVSLLVVFGQEHYTYHNHVFHDQGSQGVISSIQNDVNVTGIVELQKMKDQKLNFLGFYVALRELYLTNGFDKKLGFNLAILGEKIIPDFQFQELIRSLENSKAEINSGDVFLRSIKSMIKLNEPDSLIHEQWLIDLAAAIVEHSTNSKNLAYSVRELGPYLIDKGLSRVGYSNGTDLRNAIKAWATANLAGENVTENWTEPLLLAHHIIGPENFGALGDILESMPWLTKNGMYPRDADYVRFYQNRVNSAVSNADVAVKLLTAIKGAFENATNTIGVPDTLLNRLAQADVLSGADSPVFTNAAVESNPLKKSIEDMKAILAEIKEESVKEKFMGSAKSAIGSGIGGFEGVKKALVAGARLVKNLGGSVDNAKAKCLEVVRMAQVDPLAYEKFNSAIQVILKMDGTDASGRQGYKILFEQFLEKPNLSNEFLFDPSHFKDLTSLQKFLTDVSAPPSSAFLRAIDSLIKRNLRLSIFRQWVRENDNDWVLVRNLEQNFGIRLNTEDAKKVQVVVKDIANRATSQSELQEYLKAVRDVVRSGSAETLTKAITGVESLSRDGGKLDVFDAFAFMNSLTAGPSNSQAQRLAPFKGLEPMVINNGTYMEVFLAMQSLLEDPRTASAKCEFIGSFFQGQDLSVVQAFGVDTEKIRKQSEAVEPVLALSQLLRASKSFANLGTLLNFHKNFTTNTDATESIRMIAEMIEYLRENGYN